MADLITIDIEYSNWIHEVSQRYRNSQIKASVHVNDEMLRFYWSLGKDIVEMHAESKWGAGFYNNLSRDLQKMIPDASGFSARNLRYMESFYMLYRESFLPQVVAKSQGDEGGRDLPQTVADFPSLLGRIPWGHHRLIIDKM